MNNPLVSVIIPCYNCESHVRQAIDSSLNQTYSNVEVVVIDDGSRDGSWGIINIYKNIKKIRQENAGACAARNKGLEVCSGSYIKFLDSDDFLYEECIEKQVRSLASYDTKSITYGRHRVFKEDANKIKNSKIDLRPGPSQCTSLVLNNLPISLPLYPKVALLEVQGFDENLRSRQEWSLNIRLAIEGYSFSNSCDLTFCQRIHFSESRISSRKLIREDELENLKAIYKGVSRNDAPGFHDAWAWKFWNQGRQFLKIGDEESADCFFKEAKKISPQKYKHYWPKTYRIATSVLGYSFFEALKLKLF